MKALLLVLALAGPAAAEPVSEFYKQAAAVERLDAEGKRPKAARLLAALELPPGVMGVYLRRSELRVRLGDFPGAEADLRAALALWPMNFEVLCNLAQFLRERSRLAESLEIANLVVKVTEEIPAHNRAERWLQRGETYLKMERYDDAEADGERALRDKPEDPTTLWFMVQVLLRRGDPRRALPYADRMVAAGAPGAEKARALAQRGQVKEALGDAEGGDADLAAALAQDSSEPVALEARMQRLRAQGRIQEALALSDAMIAAAGSSPPIRRAILHQQRSLTRRLAGDIKGSDEDAREALRRQPDAASPARVLAEPSERLVTVSTSAPAAVGFDALIERALAHAGQGRRDAAVRDLEEAEKLGADGVLLDAYLRVGRPDLALPLAERLVAASSALTPMEKSEALEHRALALAAAGRSDDALADFAAATAAAPARRGPLLGASRVLAKLGRDAEALAAVDALVAVSSGASPADAAEAYAWRAERRAAGGDFAGAESDHRAAEEALPGHHARSPGAAGAWAAAVARRSRPEALALLARLRAHPAAGARERAALGAAEAEARWLDGDAARAAALMSEALRRDAQAACVSAPLLSNRSTAAASYFDACVARLPKDPGLRTDRGVARWRRGLKAQALADFRAALAASPGFLPAALSLSAGLEQSGRKAEAAAVLSKALEHADPGAEPADAARAELARLNRP